MAVVKADGYGHGAVDIARTAIESGSDRLGVARLHEAEKLRKAGINASILVFGFTHSEEIHRFVDLDLTATVYSLEMARQLSKAASSQGVTLKTHLKVDSGMGRVGLLPDSMRAGRSSRGEAASEVRKIVTLPGLDFEGIYTHFASADSADKSYAEHQLQVFTSFLDELKLSGVEFELRHAANSAAVIDLPGSHFDMVRAGIAIYGLYPSGEVDRSSVELKPVMAFKSFVTSVKKVPKGFKVSYGMTYETDRPTCIASVPAGYADGFSRLLSSKGCMLVKGMRAPIAGRVCMDQTLIDVGHIPEVKPGDEVVLFGSQGREEITADEIASLTNTINYEIVSSLTSRVAKYYIN